MTVSQSKGGDELGVGGIAGISAGAALLAVSAVIGILALIWYLHRRRNQRYSYVTVESMYTCIIFIPVQ